MARRAEGPTNSAAGDIKEGSVHYYDWSTRFPAEFPTLSNPGSFCSAMQLFGGSDGTHGSGSPSIALSCHEPGSGPQLLSFEGIDTPWQTTLAKGQGWHRFVLKVTHRNSPTVGRVTFWYDPPGGAGFSKVLDNLPEDTFNPPPAGSAGDTGLFYWKLGYYRGSSDPAGTNPWVDTKGGVMSACHEIDPACGGTPEPPPGDEPPPAGAIRNR